MKKISITTPSIRPELIKIVADCVQTQEFMDWEWLIGTRKDLVTDMKRVVGDDKRIRVIEEPPKEPEDFYVLCKCWNKLFKEARGELIVNIVDGIWFSPEILTMLWDHYINNKRSCIGGIGHQYASAGTQKPQVLEWRDVRDRQKEYGSFWEVEPIDFEFCLGSVPRQAIVDVGGMDPIGDHFAALFEKEMFIRISKLGYRFFLDASCEYRAIRHPRIAGEDIWNQKYREGFSYFDKCLKEIIEGKRVKINGLEF